MEIDLFRQECTNLMLEYEVEPEYLNAIWQTIKEESDQHFLSVVSQIRSTIEKGTRLYTKDFKLKVVSETDYEYKPPSKDLPWPRGNALDKLLKENNAKSLYELVKRYGKEKKL